MKNTSKAVVIGELVCQCGRCSYVEQTKRKGDFLQVRCSHCGVDQRAGKTIQAHWRETMKPVGHYQDSKTVAAYGADTVEPVVDTKPVTIPDSTANSMEPIQEPTPEPAAKPATVRRETIKSKQKYSNFSPWVGLSVLVATIGAAAIGSELLKARG
ncbi:hypothetical protein OA92_10050 [Marinomonas sp. SBI22]|uniref:hypothetical protein n=1 Tax=unclassified Marinomonas TaxID=196814 RepID=UPI0007AF8AB3|nr:MULTISPECIES: hypothetical protein [unclassified Marinomonas]KZM43093.1 hypothetical protein OA92_10050 [Marinomonas sp. SBI22]KZM44664.1 hypothetical protein OA91_09475 [Marinomonas sp. SBI8L]